MRALFVCSPYPGHFLPLVPFARALTDADHEVAFAVPEYFASTVTATGFRSFPAGLAQPPSEVLPQLRSLTGSERAAFFQREIFGGLFPRHLIPDLLALASQWAPDLIVCEGDAYGGGISAEYLGLPHATVGILAAGDLPGRSERIVEALSPQLAALGLPPDPNLDLPHRYLSLSPFPPSFRDPSSPFPPTTYPVSPTTQDRAGEEELPAWVEGLLDQLTVYVGLGTAYNKPEVFRTLIAGLRDEATNLILTVGRDQDPADYGPQPANVHIERYLPLSLLLGHCDLAVTHGGSGTLMAALSQGIPLVITPIAADHPANAARCQALGLGRVVELQELTPQRVRQAAQEVLADGSFRRNAKRIRDEIAALPGPSDIVPLLERLAADKRPLRFDGDPRDATDERI